MKNFNVLLKSARQSDRDTNGVAASVLHCTFTPIELLGVITVITILAAIGLI